MKLKKWLKCLLMTMALMMVVNVGVVSTTLPVVAAKTKTETVKKGTTFWKGDLQYKVTSLKGKKGEATLIGAKSNVTSVTVPKTVKNGKYTLTVTVIGANAFKKCKKLETVTTNTVIKEIGKNAFKGCKQLAVVDIQSKALKKVGKNALKGISKEAVVTVPEGKDDSYEKLLNVPVQTPDEGDAAAAAVPATAEEGTTPVTEAPAQTEAKTPETEAKAPEQTSAPASEANLTSAAPEASTLTPEVKASDAKATTQTEAKAPTEDETAAATPEAPEKETQAQTETAAPTPDAPEKEAQNQTEAATPTAEAPEKEAKAQTETAAPTPDAPEKDAQNQTEAAAPTATPEAPVQTEAETSAPVPKTTVPAKKTASKMAQKKAPASAAPNATEPTPEVKKQTETETDAPATTPETQAETKTKTDTPATTPETQAETKTDAPATTPETQAETKTDAPTSAPEAETQAVAPTPEPDTQAQTDASASAPEMKNSVQTEAETPAQQETDVPTQTEAETPAETEHVCEFTWVVTKEPYCGYLGNDMTWRDTGSRTGTCAVCGKTVKEGLRAEHEFVVTKNVEPTCTTRGATYSKCTKCGYQSINLKDENGKIREALGHSMVHHDDPATCTEDGRSYDQCERCGLVENETITAKKIGHDFSAGNVAAGGARLFSAANDSQTVELVKEATCTQDGLLKITCAHDGCGETKTQRIPRTGHEMTEERIAATCTTDQKDVFTCTKCGYTETKVEYGTRHGHKLSEPVTVVESTTTTKGYAVKDCTECEYEERIALPLAECDHLEYEFVSTKGENEGALASMSRDGKSENGWIKTARCKNENCQMLFYLYNVYGAGTWVQWKDVPCNGHGHKWDDEEDDGHVYCTVCGTVKPEDGSDNSRARIVWGSWFVADPKACTGFELPGGGMSYAAFLTTISAGNHLEVEPPKAHSGYRFDHWALLKGEKEWVKVEEDSDNLSVKGTTLSVSCDYMDETFLAVYVSETGDQDSTEAVPASEVIASEDVAAPSEVAAPADEPVSTGTPQVIHGETEIDVSLILDGNSSAENSAHEPHDIVEHHEPVVVEGHTEAAE